MRATPTTRCGCRCWRLPESPNDASAAAHHARAMPTPQAAQSLPQLLERTCPYRFMLAARHGVAHRPVERREILGMQPARLPFLEPQPDDAPYTLLDIVIDGDAVAVQEDR